MTINSFSRRINKLLAVLQVRQVGKKNVDFSVDMTYPTKEDCVRISLVRKVVDGLPYLTMDVHGRYATNTDKFNGTLVKDSVYIRSSTQQCQDLDNTMVQRALVSALDPILYSIGTTDYLAPVKPHWDDGEVSYGNIAQALIELLTKQGHVTLVFTPKAMTVGERVWDVGRGWAPYRGVTKDEKRAKLTIPKLQAKPVVVNEQPALVKELSEGGGDPTLLLANLISRMRNLEQRLEYLEGQLVANAVE